VERAAIQEKIAAREPFLDQLFHHINADGTQRQFRVSGEPMFNRSCRLIGYRGIGVEIFSRPLQHGIAASHHDTQP
jgi:hypothetical protein